MSLTNLGNCEKFFFCLFSYLKSFPLCSFGKVNKLSSCVGICLITTFVWILIFSRFWKEILKAVKCSFTPVSFVHWHFKCITSPTTYVEVSRIWCIWETWSTVVGYPKVLLTFWVMHVKMSWIYFPNTHMKLNYTETEKVTVFLPKSDQS